jgi:hypothetical protein
MAVAYQNAAAYAKDRLQGRAPTGAQSPGKPADSILVHPDVRRMLLTARAYTEGGRALAAWTALLIDREHSHPDEAVRHDAGELMALLTPVVKAFLTDNGWETTSLCQQVLGGHGYIAEWGMDQFVRDARINMIYEGTNGIQALDLLGRKVLADGGAKFGRFAALVGTFLQEQAGRADLAEFTAPLSKLLADTIALTTEIGARAKADPNEVGAASVPYLRIVGHLVFAWLWARMAAVALDRPADAFHQAKLATARFYFAWLLPETESRFREARAGAATLMALRAEDF